MYHKSYGKELNSSLSMVSINHMLWLMLLARTMLLGYTLTMKQIGCQLYLSRKIIIQRTYQKQYLKSKQWDTKSVPMMLMNLD